MSLKTRLQGVGCKAEKKTQIRQGSGSAGEMKWQLYTYSGGEGGKSGERGQGPSKPGREKCHVNKVNAGVTCRDTRNGSET